MASLASSKLVFGQRMVLVCKVSLYSQPVYKWYRNTQLVQESNKQTLIKDADATTEGKYHCEININGKSKKSDSFVYIEVNCKSLYTLGLDTEVGIR